MDAEYNSLNFPTGRAILRSPCTVRGETMDKLADGNRFCGQCNKQVYNLIGKSEAEVKALFKANGGRLCGTILVPRREAKPVIRMVMPLRKPTYFKHLAATASLLLLSQVPLHARPIAKASPSWQIPVGAEAGNREKSDEWLDGGNNTLISAVIMNQDSLVIPLDFEVLVYANKVLVTKTIAHYGLVKVELAGKVAPGATIGLVIRANSAIDPYTKVAQTHGARQVTHVLGASQNLCLTVDYEFPMEIPDAGDMIWEGDLEN
jgi:hypothetical protein